ncbi:MAG: ParA family protein [Syntrophobacterales bacterium]|nr:MAG: ParA family protein [Syntrophobacterales bacterium]
MKSNRGEKPDHIGDRIRILKDWLYQIEEHKEGKKGRIVSICNLKGGVGKTVTAINLSAFLAAYKKRTLLMDLDPQGHCGLGLGIDIENLDKSIYDTLSDGARSLTDTILPIKPNLDILPANIDLAGLETELMAESHRTTKLGEKLQSIKHLYEYIIIDCPPAIGLLTINALVASRMVIIPVQSSILSLYGLEKVMETIGTLMESFSLDIRVYLLLTLFEVNLRESWIVREKVKLAFGELLLNTIIRKNTRLNEAVRRGISILEYEPRSMGAHDYHQLAREIMEIE